MGDMHPGVSRTVQGPRENAHGQEVQATSLRPCTGQHAFLSNCFGGHIDFPYSSGGAGAGAP